MSQNVVVKKKKLIKTAMKYAVLEMGSTAAGGTPSETFKAVCEKPQNKSLLTSGVYVMYTYNEEGEETRWWDTPTTPTTEHLSRFLRMNKT
jgi:hypothetical protein